ncbi:MAG: hypothetical protein AAGA03_04150 [Planctomycetota bacterium]
MTLKRKQLSLRALLLIAPAAAVGAVLLLRSIDAATVYDVTVQQSSTCQTHNVTMTKKLVRLTYGMRAWEKVDSARRVLFPHADEVYDTRSCIPLQQEYARVYTCSECTKARDRWLASSP